MCKLLNSFIFWPLIISNNNILNELKPAKIYFSSLLKHIAVNSSFLFCSFPEKVKFKYILISLFLSFLTSNIDILALEKPIHI